MQIPAFRVGRALALATLASMRLPHLSLLKGGGDTRRPGTAVPSGYNLVMMHEAQELLKKALALPEKERADLASTLIESLDDSLDENAEAAWQEEILRRLEEVRSGKAKTTSWTTSARKGVLC